MSWKVTDSRGTFNVVLSCAFWIINVYLKIGRSVIILLRSFIGIHPSLIRSGICAQRPRTKPAAPTGQVVAALVGIPGLDD